VYILVDLAIFNAFVEFKVESELVLANVFS
jgi:hypothetical protein